MLSTLLFTAFFIVNVFGGYPLLELSSTPRYILVDLDKNWSDAQEYCEDYYDSDLATIISSNDLRDAFYLIDSNTWIGLNDIKNGGKFEWVDGTPCFNAPNKVCSKDPNFANNQPDNGKNIDNVDDEDCVWLNTDKEYTDEDCELKRNFLCNNPDYKW